MSSQNRSAKNWLDQFRIVTDNNDSASLQQEAVLMNCRILHGNRCYAEDGSIRDVCHKLSTNVLGKLLKDRKYCIKLRDSKILQKHLKYRLEKKMPLHTEKLSNLETMKSERQLEIR